MWERDYCKMQKNLNFVAEMKRNRSEIPSEIKIDTNADLNINNNTYRAQPY
jgi:transposase